VSVLLGLRTVAWATLAWFHPVRPSPLALPSTVHWENLASGTQGVAVFTSSWIAPKSDVHSQQRFFYMGHKGEVNVDQVLKPPPAPTLPSPSLPPSSLCVPSPFLALSPSPLRACSGYAPWDPLECLSFSCVFAGPPRLLNVH
jgi:hypothetical protein